MSARVFLFCTKPGLCWKQAPLRHATQVSCFRQPVAAAAAGQVKPRCPASAGSCKHRRGQDTGRGLVPRGCSRRSGPPAPSGPGLTSKLPRPSARPRLPDSPAPPLGCGRLPPGPRPRPLSGSRSRLCPPSPLLSVPACGAARRLSPSLAALCRPPAGPRLGAAATGRPGPAPSCACAAAAAAAAGWRWRPSPRTCGTSGPASSAPSSRCARPEPPAPAPTAPPPAPPRPPCPGPGPSPPAEARPARSALLPPARASFALRRARGFVSAPALAPLAPAGAARLSPPSPAGCSPSFPRPVPELTLQSPSDHRPVRVRRLRQLRCLPADEGQPRDGLRLHQLLFRRVSGAVTRGCSAAPVPWHFGWEIPSHPCLPQDHCDDEPGGQLGLQVAAHQ